MSLAAPDPAFTISVVFVTAILRFAPLVGVIVIDFAAERLTVPTTRAGSFAAGFLAVIFAGLLTRLFSISYPMAMPPRRTTTSTIAVMLARKPVDRCRHPVPVVDAIRCSSYPRLI